MEIVEAEGEAVGDGESQEVAQDEGEMTEHAHAENLRPPGTNSTGDRVLCEDTREHDGEVTAAGGASDAVVSLPTPDGSNQDVPSSDTVAVVEEPGASDETNGIQEDTTQSSTPREAVEPRSSASDHLPLILGSLSIDSLHCIASFLAPKDWASFSTASKATNRVGDQVFRRVRMHGFRCATEVVAAWKTGQFADARELSALYIKRGVPIYPHSLGHSYHTLTWRMGIEAREMEGSSESAQGGNEEPQNDEHRSASTSRPVDRFYSERYDARLNDGYSNPDLTYLEEKCLFWHHQKSDTGEAGQRSSSARTSLVPPPPILGQGPGADGAQVRFPDFRPAANAQPPEGQRGNSAQSQSPSFSEIKLAHAPRLVISVHRHLVDQHLLGRQSVDDENGAMRAPTISLSEDFYHPSFARQVSSSSGVSSGEAAGAKDDSRFNHQHPLAQSAASSDRVVPPIPTPPPSDQGTPNTASLHNLAVDGGDVVVNDGEQSAQALDQSGLRTPTPLETPILAPPPLHSSPLPETPARVEHPVLTNVDLEIYSSATSPSSQVVGQDEVDNESKGQLRTRFSSYQRRLDALLVEHENEAFDECMLDFWDEFLPTTANIQFYDRYTAVPRVSKLQKFLTKPCPKAIGIVQCEIERIRVYPKKKGVSMKGRLFPSYEYRLFIRDRRHASGVENLTRDPREDPRRDTILMTAKNRGKKHHDVSDQASQSSKKGVNNYYLFTPQQSDIDAHYDSVNAVEPASSKHPNGASYAGVSSSGEFPGGLLGRLQSNFIGTEFQIYSQSVRKRPTRTSSCPPPSSDGEDDIDYDSGFSSDNVSTSSASGRRRRFRRRSRRSLPKVRTSSAIDHPQPISEESPSRSPSPEGRRSIRRAVSLPVGNRSSRTNRRAIAHSIEPVDSSRLFRPTYCEEEDGAITYTANLLGNRPRIMDVCIPKVTLEGVAGAEWKRYLESCRHETDGASANRMLTCFKQLQHRLENPNQSDDENVNSAEDDYVPPDDFGLIALQNRPPWWNIELGAFVLNFGGRVSVASVKNFQLCDRNNQDHIMLQFGRIQGRHSFTMDFQHPLTAVQAFAIAISSLQSKISFG